MKFEIIFLIPMLLLLLICAFLSKAIWIFIEFKETKPFERIRLTFKNPRNVKDLCLGLFINSVYGLINTDTSLLNFLISLICFYGIVLSNETIERNNEKGK